MGTPEGRSIARFSIRDLLLLVAILALAFGWWLDRRPIPARFQMHTSNTQTYLFDTATGQVWYQTNTEFSQPKVKGK